MTFVSESETIVGMVTKGNLRNTLNSFVALGIITYNDFSPLISQRVAQDIYNYTITLNMVKVLNIVSV